MSKKKVEKAGSVTSVSNRAPLKDLSDLFKDKDIARCSCGSAAFFDWGIQLLSASDKFVSPRMEGILNADHVRICVGCHKPVILYVGDLYDASEYVDADAVAELLLQKSATPIARMDP